MATAACSTEGQRRWHFESGNAYFEDGQFRAAIIEFRNALEGNPDWGTARLRLAEAYEADGQTERAHQEYLRALALLPGDTQAQMRVAQHLLTRAQRAYGRERWEDAARAASAAVTVNPQLMAAHLVRAEAALMLGRTADALAFYEAIAALDPSDVNAYVALSRLHLSRNDVDAAVAYAEKAIERSPDDITARLTLIRARMGRGEDDSAAAELGRLSKLASPPAEYHVLEGTLFAKRGDAVMARRAFARALQLEPGSRDALTALTTMDVLDGDVTGAQARLEIARRDAQDDPTLLVLAAKVSMIAGELATAEVMLRRAIGRDPLVDNAIPLLARVFAAQGRVAVAVAEFDATARREPRNVTARLIAAVTLHTAGEWNDAERRYQQVLVLDPGCLLAAKHLADIHLAKAGDLTTAERLARLVAERQPHAGIFETLGSIYLRLGDRARARVALDQALRLDPQSAVARQALASLSR